MIEQNRPVLNDNFGRTFRYLRLSITDVCNFKCNYCLPDGYQPSNDNDFLCVQEIDTLVSAFAQLGLKKVRITGGEPTLRRDLPDVIARCAQQPGIEQVALTTNAYRLVDKLEQYVDAGLTQVNISLDSLDPTTFLAITGHSNFEKVMAGIEAAQQYPQLKVKLNAVLMKGFNANQMDRYLNYLRTRNLSFRFIELMETGTNGSFFSSNHVAGEQIKAYLLARGWALQPRDPLAGPAVELAHPDYVGRIGLIMPYSKDFCVTCNRLRVSSRGKLHLCLFADQGIDLRAHLRSGDVAEVKASLIASLKEKKATHELHQHHTGATKDFAMIGG